MTPTMGLALCVVRHPTTGKFLLVHETSNRGWWLPGGKVERGESFTAAAVRECLEEGGLRIAIKGIIRVEHSIHKQFARLRLIFFCEPVDLDAAPKSVADDESLEARWVTAEEVESGAFRLRASEPLEFFRFLQNGNHVMPLTSYASEGAPLLLRNAPTSFAPAPKVATPARKHRDDDKNDDDAFESADDALLV